MLIVIHNKPLLAIELALKGTIVSPASTRAFDARDYSCCQRKILLFSWAWNIWNLKLFFQKQKKTNFNSRFTPQHSSSQQSSACNRNHHIQRWRHWQRTNSNNHLSLRQPRNIEFEIQKNWQQKFGWFQTHQ